MAKTQPPTRARVHNGPQIDLGIEPAQRKAIAEGLAKMLADTYTLYLKTHNFHWNVTGPMFQTLHLMFEQQYNELALAVDLVAERIRALGHPAPGSYAQFSKLSSISEATGVLKAEDMICQLVEGQEALVRTARKVFVTAEKASDQVTIDLLTQRMQCMRRQRGCSEACWSKGRRAKDLSRPKQGMVRQLMQWMPMCQGLLVTRRGTGPRPCAVS